MVFASEEFTSLVPRFCRMYLAEWLISRCRLPATPALSLPVAVILKRFFAPDLVLSLGIFTGEAKPVATKGALYVMGPPKARRARRRRLPRRDRPRGPG